MRRFTINTVMSLLMLASAQPARAWPEPAYSEIFVNATRIMPGPLRQLLEDMEQSLERPCAQLPIGEAVARAIAAFGDSSGSLDSALEAMKEAGCSVAALNDPGMDSLVASQQQNFAVVFYGWHPLIQEGNLAEYLRIRGEERNLLVSRFSRTLELPNLSDTVETSPEFGMAAIAFSRAVTDVANVWLYVWTQVNGALR